MCQYKEQRGNGLFKESLFEEFVLSFIVLFKKLVPTEWRKWVMEFRRKFG
jgi:hypothetical protein